MKALAHIGLLAAAVMARNCKPDLYYCGSTLLAIGNYKPQIDQCLLDNGVDDPNGGVNYLFYCVGGSNGVIKFMGNCANGCKDAGSGKSDYCK